MICTLAIDPGATGGAVLLGPEGVHARAAWSWVQRRRRRETVYELRETLDGLSVHKEQVVSLSAVSTQIRQRCSFEPFDLVVEDLFIPSLPPFLRRNSEEADKYLGRCASVIALAEHTGQVYGPIVGVAQSVRRVLASEWRPSVLSIAPNASSDRAEREAIRVLTGFAPLVSGLGELGHDPHVAEAACMARWGWATNPRRNQ